jgi:hypothetical protein
MIQAPGISLYFMACCTPGCTVVERSTQYTQIKGFNPAPVPGREEMTEIKILYFHANFTAKAHPTLKG